MKTEGLTLCGVLETHFHADFVSGHCELGQRAGVPIYFGPTSKERCVFPVHEVKDEEVRKRAASDLVF
jgi:glyoxylase-like metal-dependent hydrolase (beta-lactamase superfamily II)